MRPAREGRLFFGEYMAKKAKFVPKAALEDKKEISSEYSSEQIAAATSEVIAEEENKKLTPLQKADVAWTIISTIYAISSVCTFIVKKWVASAYTYALIPMLAVFVGVFIALVALSFKDVKKLKTNIKTYRKVLGIFKAFVNVFFLALTAVSMVGIAMAGNFDLVKWIVFGFTFLVALVQLALKITKFAMKCAKNSLSKKYKVEMHNFKDGAKKKKTTSDKIKENSYKQ